MPLNPPRHTGPPLKSLKAFEAAARHCSFSKSADELCVTPGAIAQQIKILENWVGDKLFDRQAKSITLTPLGKSISAELSDVFDHLGKVVQKLRVVSSSQDIYISALPSVAQFWIMPILPQIRNAVPGVKISITALEQPPNLLRDPFDISIFFEDKPDPDNSIVIGRDEIFPVCTKKYAQKFLTNITQPQIDLIHDAAWQDDWKKWLAKSTELNVTETTGSMFSLYSLAIEETLNGAGILIGHSILVKNLIDSGRLIAPFKTRVSLDRYITIRIAESSKDVEHIKKVVSLMEDYAT